MLRSLFAHEPHLAWLVLVDDSPTRRRLETMIEVPATCRVTVLRHPRQGIGDGYLGGLCVSVLHGFQWLSMNTTVRFALKIDADSLVVAPFAKRIEQVFTNCPNIGLIGAEGRTCNREQPTYGFETRAVSPLLRLAKWLSERSDESTTTTSQAGLDDLSPLAPHLIRAIRHGYRSMHYCQGGAYAVSSHLLQSMAVNNCFASGPSWSFLSIGEDVMMGMFAYSVGMQIRDMSLDNEPFGCHWKGLPYPLDVLKDRKHSILHSLKSDRLEEEISNYAAFGYDFAENICAPVSCG